MPIHFRCAFCNQLLGIARRKAGSVINCPTCGGPLVVPPLENGPDQPENKSSAQRLLEDYDVDVLLKPPATAQAVGGSPAADVGVTESSKVSGTHGADGKAQSSRAHSNKADATPQPGIVRQGIFLSTSRATVVAILLALLFAAAFVAGFLVGRGLG